jgi:hypothetical protein
MIQTVDTFSFRSENTFTSSYPMLFTCKGSEGFANYFVKYIQNKSEFDCLVYEILCQKLAIYFTIHTPEIALVRIVQDSFDPNRLVKNKLYLGPGIIAFGSKEVKNNVMLSKQEIVPDKRTFNTYQSPLDLVKILLFDLHIDNRDRIEDNFNLLVTKEKPSKIYAIDHFFCFGGSMHIGKFTPQLPFNKDNTIIRSEFFRQMMGYLHHSEILDSVENYFYLCNPNKISAIVDEVFTFLPQQWAISSGLESRLKSFLTDPKRLELIKTGVIEHLQYIKSSQK